MHLRTYSVIHMGSPIFKYCASGDIASMQRLFENGQATPLDVKFYSGDYSLTLIEVSSCIQVYGGHFNVRVSKLRDMDN